MRISLQIAVHCHYGFNRTGFLVVSYLVEVEKWDVDAAINTFAKSKVGVACTQLTKASFFFKLDISPFEQVPGIKHAHFRDELRRRYQKTPGDVPTLVPGAFKAGWALALVGGGLVVAFLISKRHHGKEVPSRDRGSSQLLWCLRQTSPLCSF